MNHWYGALTTTQRHMHLSLAVIDGAIRLLEHPQPLAERRDILETAESEISKCVKA